MLNRLFGWIFRRRSRGLAPERLNAELAATQSLYCDAAERAHRLTAELRELRAEPAADQGVLLIIENELKRARRDAERQLRRATRLQEQLMIRESATEAREVSRTTTNADAKELERLAKDAYLATRKQAHLAELNEDLQAVLNHPLPSETDSRSDLGAPEQDPFFASPDRAPTGRRDAELA